MPPGLTLSTGGLLSGTPSAIGGFTFTVTAIDITCSGSRDYTMNSTGGSGPSGCSTTRYPRPCAS